MTEFDKIVELLDMAWYLRSEIVPCLVGPPGIGKTAAVEQHARKHHAKVVKIVASRCVPSETVGMTMPDHDNRSMEIYNSMQLSSLRDGDILFLDELLEADQFVLSTLLTVIESREMADGTPLPHIQIIAATNDTIPPEQLKGNIRQRFMFRRFRVDPEQTHDYILERTGIDVPTAVLDRLTDDGTDYNFLTPRSLTKLVLWIDSVPKDEVNHIGTVIDGLWNSNLGTTLVRARQARDNEIKSPERQFRDAVKRIVDEVAHDENDYILDSFEDCTLGEIYEYLQGLPEWQEIEARLDEIEIEEPDDEEQEIRF